MGRPANTPEQQAAASGRGRGMKEAEKSESDRSNNNGPSASVRALRRALVACGGCPVAPGDIIVGDDDGVAVVPRDIQANLLDLCKARLHSEQAVRDRIAAGMSTIDIFKLPGPDETK